MRLTAAAIAAAAVAGCAHPAVPADTARPRADAPRRVVLDDAPDGLSGLTIDGDGVLWAVPERERVLVALEGERVVRRVPLEADLGTLDVEAVAWIEGSRFALGTESDDPARDGDRVLLVEVAARALVVGEIALPYAAIGATPAAQDGLEALCHVDGELVAVVEHVVEGEGERFAAGGRLSLRDRGAWRPFRLRLTTDVGKISDLSCRRGAGGAIELTAIERGLDEERWASRVVRFELPRESAGAVLSAEVLLDLAGWLDDRPNPEGLAFDAAGDLWLVIDNYYGVRTGPSLLYHVPAALLGR